MKRPIKSLLFTFFAWGLTVFGQDSKNLTNGIAQKALDKFFGKGLSSVVGIQSTPDMRGLITVDINLKDFRYKGMERYGGDTIDAVFSGQAHAEFKAYSNGSWILSEVAIPEHDNIYEANWYDLTVMASSESPIVASTPKDSKNLTNGTAQKALDKFFGKGLSSIIGIQSTPDMRGLITVDINLKDFRYKGMERYGGGTIDAVFSGQAHAGFKAYSNGSWILSEVAIPEHGNIFESNWYDLTVTADYEPPSGADTPTNVRPGQEKGKPSNGNSQSSVTLSDSAPAAPQNALETTVTIPVSLAEQYAEAERNLNKAWTAMTSQQKSALREEQRNWIKMKDSISVSDPKWLQEIRKRTEYLKSLSLSSTSRAAIPNVNYATRIIGQWQGSRHIRAFYEHGGFALDPEPGDEPLGKWRVEGDKIMTRYGDGSSEVVERIVEFRPDFMIVESNGQSYSYKRVK
jgi:uncharacterized protein YecT (DUF1311 family)